MASGVWKDSVWRHPLLEGLAVLVGILVAFGIDASWQARSERLSERAYLEAVRNELVDARQHFVDRDRELARDMERAAEIVRILGATEALNLADDSVTTLALQLGPQSVQTPPRAALDDLTSSGGIALVDNSSVRRAVASYQSALNNDAAAQELMVDLWLNHFAPYRSAHATIDYSSVPGFPAVQRESGVDRDAYVRNRTYGNLVMARMLRVMGVRASHAAAIEELDRLLELLELERR
jgi:hypothetical protein